MTLTKTEERQLAELLITGTWEVLIKYLKQLETEQKEKIYEKLWTDVQKAKDEYLKCEWLTELINLLKYKKQWIRNKTGLKHK